MSKDLVSYLNRTLGKGWIDLSPAQEHSQTRSNSRCPWTGQGSDQQCWLLGQLQSLWFGYEVEKQSRWCEDTPRGRLDRASSKSSPA